MKRYSRDRQGLLAGLTRRWPNAIEATTVAGGPYNDFPRLPFQIATYFLHAGQFVIRQLSTISAG